MNDTKLKQLYFSHDIYADKDEKIVKMFYHFRKNIDEFSEEFLRKNFYYASFGLFWQIVQYLHRNELTVDEIPMLADELRADESFVRLILEKFELFRVEDDKIISDRILKNLQKTNEKSQTNRNSAQFRWLLSSFAKYYEEFFEEKPVLQSSEIEALKRYNDQIPDLKDKLRDIIYTLKNLKFDTDINFKPGANWLLKGNNLAKLVNGEFGALRHKKTEKELNEEQRHKLELEKIQNQPSELDLKINSCSGKSEALDIIAEYYKGRAVVYERGKCFVLPALRELMSRFGITDKELSKFITEKGVNNV